MAWIERFAEQIRASAAADGAIQIRGGGSKNFYGGPLLGDVLDTRAHAGIIAYEPTELVVTARCGTLLTDIETELARNGQMFA
ncbi:MAG: FAD-binding protein, partial [Burkholderiales bacterium]